MGKALQRRIKVSTLPPIEVEGYLNLLVSADTLRAHMEELCAGFGITHSQYNVLRILRGALPDGHPRCEIACRLVERAPDVTRLLDRLERGGWVQRSRSHTDARLSVAQITDKGLKLLDAIQPQLEAMHRRHRKLLTSAEWKQLSTLCEKLYAERE